MVCEFDLSEQKQLQIQYRKLGEDSVILRRFTFFPTHHNDLMLMLPYLPSKENTVNSKPFDQFCPKSSRDFLFCFGYRLSHLIPIQVNIKAVHNRKSVPTPVHSSTSANYHKNDTFLNHCCDELMERKQVRSQYWWRWELNCVLHTVEFWRDLRQAAIKICNSSF